MRTDLPDFTAQTTEGAVIRQAPRGRAKAAKDSIVEIVVARAPAPSPAPTDTVSPSPTPSRGFPF